MAAASAVASLSDYRDRRDAVAKPSDAQIKDLLSQARDYVQTRQRVAREQRKLYLGNFDVPRPEGITHWSPIHCMLGAQQAGLVKGVVLGTDEDGHTPMPSVEAYVAQIGKAAKSDAEEAENALNHLFPRLEAQNGPLGQVWEPVINDQVLVGWGVARLRPVPSRYAKGVPQVDYLNDPKGSLTRRAQAIKGKGGWLQKLPLHWEHVLAERCVWFDDPDDGRITQFYELKTRRLSDLTRKGSPYANPALMDWFDTLKDAEREKASSVLVDLWCYEDDDWHAYVVDGCTTQLGSASGSGGDYLYISQMLDKEFSGGKVVGLERNPLGRSSYCIYPGLSMGAEDPAIRYYGAIYLQRDHIRVLSQWWSIILSRAAQTAVPTMLASQQAVTVNGVPTWPAQDPDGTPKMAPIEPGKINWLPAGVSLQEWISANHTPAEQDILGQIKGEAESLGIPASILDAGGGQSGYLNAQVVQAVLSRFRPLILNNRLAWQEQVAIALECLKFLGEPLSVLIGTKERSAEWYTLDPDKLDGLELHLKVKYALNTPTDLLANIQAATTLTQSELMSRETAMSRFLDIDDVEREKELMLLDKLESSPPLQDTLMQDVLQSAGIKIQDHQAQQQGAVSPDDFRGMPPEGVQAFIDAAQPGQPGYSTAQRLAQQGAGTSPPTQPVPLPAGNGPTPLQTPAGTPHTPQRPRGGSTIKGRPQGQSRRPGGPKGRGVMP